MKIGLNGEKILISKPAGPEIYTINTFKALAQEDKINEYVVYLTQTPDMDFWNDFTGNNKNFSYKVLKKFISWTQISLSWELFWHPVDILFGATHTIPVFHPLRLKVISMIHGLEYKVNRMYEKSQIRKIIHPMILWWVLKFSTIVIVPSESTKTAILSQEWPFISDKKIKIIREGVNKNFYKRNLDEIRKVREKYKLGNHPYIFFVSTIQPRKNLPRTIQAFSLFIKEHEEFSDYKFLISGKLGWIYWESLEAPKNYDVEDSVIFLGRTPDEDLPSLMSGAECFINCSLEEGFGIPLLEAMACETPSLVSDIGAFHELGSDVPLYVNPENAADIKKGLEEVLIKKINQNKTGLGKKISMEFTWEKGAQELISVFNSSVKNI